MSTELEQALATLGPLEARIMRVAWTSGVPQPFTVRDMQSRMTELAYTTVMTTLRRLADKGLLVSTAISGQRAHEYRTRGGPDGFLTREGAREAGRVVEKFGDAALAAFAAHLSDLTPEQRARLERLT